MEIGERIEIKSGLKAGDIVVMTGAYLLSSECIFKKGANPMEAMKMYNIIWLIYFFERLQRLFLKVRQKSIAIHPMTQILEEPQTKQVLNQSIGINENRQFILCIGYLKTYPGPVSLRRLVDQIIRTVWKR